ncbi:hypothetical protein V9T40_007433 [Parthenolecanium corni]|uniref:Neurotransmitter-gated ion-channel ligand-binding domain-containing protein n=1 Tax=Parthenolecanium corni TaxID=536013 RepID=A0AAN9TYL5_9HEMI
MLSLYKMRADGDYEVTLMTKATVYCTGLVVWQPPTIYKSSCSIDVEYFPYDVQTCVLKLGSWTYDGFKVNASIVSGGDWRYRVESSRDVANTRTISYEITRAHFSDLTERLR